MALIARKSQATAQDRIRTFVAENAETLEPGLTVLETGLRLGHATIDVVAVDARQTLVLIAIGDVADTRLLLSSLDAYLCCLAFPDNLTRLYPNLPDAKARPPRLIFVARQVPDEFVELVELLSAVRVECQELSGEAPDAHASQLTLASELRGAGLSARATPPAGPVRPTARAALAVAGSAALEPVGRGRERVRSGPAPVGKPEAATQIAVGYDAGIARQWESLLVETAPVVVPEAPVIELTAPVIELTSAAPEAPVTAPVLAVPEVRVTESTPAAVAAPVAEPAPAAPEAIVAKPEPAMPEAPVTKPEPVVELLRTAKAPWLLEEVPAPGGAVPTPPAPSRPTRAPAPKAPATNGHGDNGHGTNGHAVPHQQGAAKAANGRAPSANGFPLAQAARDAGGVEHAAVNLGARPAAQPPATQPRAILPRIGQPQPAPRPAPAPAKPAAPRGQAPGAGGEDGPRSAKHPALESLRFPKTGVSRQWQEFLDQLAANQ